MTEPTRVLLVGTHHFVSRKDMVKPDVVDMTTPERQAEIDEVVERLAAYRPTKVVVELEYASDAAINDDYAAYRRGEHELASGEAEQVGFRLADRLGHERVFPTNIMHKWWEPAVEQVTASNPEAGALWEQLQARYAESGERSSARLREMSLVQLWAEQNTPQARRSGLADYLNVFTRLVDGQEYAGADMTGNWYHRNVRIYANILRVTQPGDRLFVLYGAGHVAPLLHFFKASGEFAVDDPLPYLTRPVSRATAAR